MGTRPSSESPLLSTRRRGRNEALDAKGTVRSGVIPMSGFDPAALRALLAAATPGRWIAGGPRDDGTAQVYCPHSGPLRVIVPVAETEPHNAALIAALRNAAPALLDAADERDRLRLLLGRIVKYVVEDRATTPGSTRLARLVDEIRVELQHAGALEATKEKT